MAVAIAVAWMQVSQWRSDLAEAAVLQTAPRCGAGTDLASCVELLPATVVAIRKSCGRSGCSYYYTLDVRPFGSQEVQGRGCPCDAPEGSQVRVHEFRGRLVGFDTATEAVTTNEDPSVRARSDATFAGFAVTAGLGLAWAAFALISRYVPLPEPPPSFPFTVGPAPVTIAVVAYAVLVFASLTWFNPTALALVLALAGGVLAVVWYLLQRSALTVSEHGIQQRGLMVPWDSVRSVDWVAAGRTRYLAIGADTGRIRVNAAMTRLALYRLLYNLQHRAPQAGIDPGVWRSVGRRQQEVAFEGTLG